MRGPDLPRFRLTLATLFIAGVAIGLLMVSRSQVAGDQLNLLARGWRLAADGILVPFGNPTSAGGTSPGPLQSLLTGLPLLLWRVVPNRVVPDNTRQPSGANPAAWFVKSLSCA